jgi:aspartate aminotransferase-like enzyme
MLPPGLGFLALSQRAWAAVEKNPAPKNYYFDLRKYRKSMEDGDTPFTPANTLIEALAVSLKMVRDETIETVWKRTHTIAEAYRQGVKALGLTLFSQRPADSVTAVNYPAGVSDKDFRGALKNKHNVHVAGGQGSMEGKLFRVNHMGYTDAYDCLAVVAAVEHVLRGMGKLPSTGPGVAAAQKVLSELF